MPKEAQEGFFLARLCQFDDPEVLGCGVILTGEARTRIDPVQPHLVAQSHHHFGQAGIFRGRRQQSMEGAIRLDIERDVLSPDRARDVFSPGIELAEFPVRPARDQ